MRLRIHWSLLFISVAQLISVPAFACPLCHSSTAKQVRTGIISTSLDGITIPALILPFAVLTLVICLMQFNWDEWSQDEKT